MTVKTLFSSSQSTNSDLLIILIDNSFKLKGYQLEIDKNCSNNISKMLKSRLLENKKGQSITFPAFNRSHSFQVMIYCVGKLEDLEIDKTDRLGGKICSEVMGKYSNVSISCEFSNDVNDNFAASMLHGFMLRSYSFNKYKAKTKNKIQKILKSVEIITKSSSKVKRLYSPLKSLMDGVYLTRNLVSEPANVLTPKVLAEEAAKLKDLGVKVEILDLKKIKKLKMGALLGVAQGSSNEPRVVSMSWNGNKGKSSKSEVCFVGKGVTFDTGGISIKPSGGMEDMKWDMGGSGVVIGLMKALAGRKAKVNISAVVGLVENMPSGKAQRPGDVVTASSGHTIEVINTDAEGRLVLADAVTYAIKKFNPKKIIDLATLTGAVIVSLGNQRAGLFSNDDKLAQNIFDSGEKTGEKVWRLPVGEEYDDDIKSAIADMHNIGSGRGAGSTAGAKFIEQFVQNIPWAHLDIACVTWSKSNSDLYPKGGTAFGVRLLNSYVKNYIE